MRKAGPGFRPSDLRDLTQNNTKINNIYTKPSTKRFIASLTIKKNLMARFSGSFIKTPKKNVLEGDPLDGRALPHRIDMYYSPFLQNIYNMTFIVEKRDAAWSLIDQYHPHSYLWGRSSTSATVDEQMELIMLLSSTRNMISLRQNLEKDHPSARKNLRPDYTSRKKGRPFEN